MRFFYTIPEALKYAKHILKATQNETEAIREQLEARSVAKFNGLYLFYDELGILD